MPKMNRLQLLTAVEQLRLETPVLMITAHANHGVMAKALAAGATDFIANPFDRDEFVRAVRHGLRLSRLQSIAVNLEDRHRKTSRTLGIVREKLHQYVLRKLKDTHH
jgi:DNA-binding NtrC family response regulator